MGERKLLDFGVTLQSKTWKGEGGVQLVFDVTETLGGQDGLGMMRLTVPGRMVRAGEAALLRVQGSASGSRQWFGVYELP